MTTTYRVTDDEQTARAEAMCAYLCLPTERGPAVAALVEADVARWGEQEREASRRSHASRSVGLALNELANRADLSGWEAAPIRGADKAKALRTLARMRMTGDDLRDLRQGG
jgi:hypothetical protein